MYVVSIVLWILYYALDETLYLQIEEQYLQFFL